MFVPLLHVCIGLCQVVRAQRPALPPSQLRKGFEIVVADEYNHCIRAIAPNGTDMCCHSRAILFTLW